MSHALVQQHHQQLVSAERRDGRSDTSDSQQVVVYEEGTVGHLVQSEDLPAPPPAVARNKVGDRRFRLSNVFNFVW